MKEREVIHYRDHPASTELVQNAHPSLFRLAHMVTWQQGLSDVFSALLRCAAEFLDLLRLARHRPADCGMPVDGVAFQVKAGYKYRLAPARAGWSRRYRRACLRAAHDALCARRVKSLLLRKDMTSNASLLMRVRRLLVQTVQKTVDFSCSSWLVLHQLLCNDRCRGWSTVMFLCKCRCCSLSTVVDIPAVVVQTVPVGVLQLQLSRQSSTFLVWRRARWGLHCLKTVRFHSCSMSSVRGVFWSPR